MPGVLAHALILHGDVLQSLIVRVVARHRQWQHALSRGVHHAVVDAQGHVGARRHKLCRDIHRVADDVPCAGRVALALRGQHDGDVLIFLFAQAVLCQLQVHAHRASGRYQHTAAIAEGVAVNGQRRALRIRIVDGEEAEVAVLARLALVGEQQVVGGRLAGRYATQAVGSVFHSNLRHLNLHGGSSDGVLARLIVLRLLLALIRTGGLSATGHEDSTQTVGSLEHVHRQGVVVASLHKCIACGDGALKAILGGL